MCVCVGAVVFTPGECYSRGVFSTCVLLQGSNQHLSVGLQGSVETDHTYKWWPVLNKLN